jgi:hypothetical protein
MKKHFTFLYIAYIFAACFTAVSQTNIKVSVKSISVSNLVDCDAGAGGNSDFVFEYRVDDNSPGAYSNNNPVSGSIGLCNYVVVNEENGPFSMSPLSPGAAVFSPTTGIFFDRNYNCKSELPTVLTLTWRAYENDDVVSPSVVPVAEGATTPEVISYTVPGSSGTYTAQFTQISPDGGCPQTYNIEFSVDISDGSFSPLSLNHAEGSVVCTGSSNGLIEAAHTGGSGSVVYDWSYDGTGDFDDNGTINNVTAGTYTIVVKDNLNCRDSAVVSVEEVDPPVNISAFTSSLDSVCAGQSNVMYAVASQSNVVYFWNFSGSGASINGTGNSVTINFADPSYNGTLSVYAQNQCSVTPTLNMPVAVLPLPVISFSGNTTTCDNVSQTLTASGASTYSWSTGGTSQSITVSPTVTSVYSVQGTDAYGCSSTAYFTMNVLPSPTLQLSGSTASVCPQQTVTVNASGNGNLFIWSDGFIGASHTVQASTTTIYTVTNTFPNSCYTQKTYTLNVFPGPQLAVLGNTIVCEGSSASFTASGAVTYSWNNGAGTATTDFTPVSSGSLSVTGVTGDGCRDSLMMYVNVVSSPTVTISGTDTICQGQSATLTAAANGTVSYGWNSGNNTATINVSPSSTFTYVVVADNGGCSASASHEVFVKLIPALDFTVTPFMCTSDPAYTLVATPSGGSFSGSGVSGIKFDPSIGSGIYPITYSVNVGNGCNASSTQTIEVAVCTGLADSKAQEDVKIFPNPVISDMRVLSNEKIKQIRVYDFSGKLVFEKLAGDAEWLVDLSSLSKGIYMLMVSMEDSREKSLKFAKE